MRLKEITWRKSGEEKGGMGEERNKGKRRENSEDSMPGESNIKMSGRREWKKATIW